ncbi:MAG TPA: 3-phosphoserine/phosphohydroxythreonine transaminase [Steroidobacteraceae bacterium]|nr:3-phosphoserine/phosphohydroxythreonine transaminase [Steroidobacteraceae bacterium]
MRVFNFAAGPAMLPLPVLEQARDELLDWRGCGASVMELSHRSKAFAAVAEELQSGLRELLGIPGHYRVLFLQGGATGQFSAVPLNLAGADATVDYLNTGYWSKRASNEAQRYCKVHIAADEEASSYTTVPEPGKLELSSGAAYVHYTPNETIGGVEFPYIPDTGRVPLVADMSSTILSRPLDVRRFGLIYAGAQKNIGPAGLCVVIVREDLLGRARPTTPSVFDYKRMADDTSLLNTPPTFSWYVASLTLKWLKGEGGLTAMAERNGAKAQALYQTIDASGLYRNPVAKNCRSWMNVVFTLGDAELDKRFLAEARTAGLTNLEGHRSLGGMRASLYNAMPRAGVQALIDFMRDFERRNG